MATTAVKERPILFSGPMVRAILDGKKTQTRRVAKFKPLAEGLNLNFSGLEADDQGVNGWALASRDGRGTWNERTELLRCPYGHVGDRLWVRETWAVDAPLSEAKRQAEDAMAGRYVPGSGPYFRATEPAPDTLMWRPSIFMPRWACRIVLEVANVRVQRLKSISHEDAVAEGCHRIEPCEEYPNGNAWGRAGYATLWDSINKGHGHSWESNPWVWVVEFVRIARI